MTRPRYSTPELNRPWETLRAELKLEVLREDVAAIREAVEAIVSSLGLATPQDNHGRYPRTTSRPNLAQLSVSVDDLQHDMKDALKRLAVLERPK